MTTYYAYLRVSTVKQGEGVSLEAQRDAISVYADKHNLNITNWFEEKVTAARKGRPLFNKMITDLRRGQAHGVVVHKIDRSARNFADWAMIGELLDEGIDVRFAHEALDMRSRGGRLTADIQAVIAADYVRNLREECLRGRDGRLKQGLFPFGAPIGYLDQGKGKPKIPDPERAPFVRMAFELYASGQFSIRGLQLELRSRGFRNRNGKPISKGCIENLLANPFYCGRIYLKRTGRTYAGVHKTLISEALFARVQSAKAGKQNKRQTKHNHTYRRLIKCGACGRSLIGELQKGQVYMRCHKPGCPTATIREDVVEGHIKAALIGVQLSDQEFARLQMLAEEKLTLICGADRRQGLELRLANLKAREDRLTDAVVDQIIDQEAYKTRKADLVIERSEIEADLKELSAEHDYRTSMLQYLELARSLYLHYETAEPAERRRIVEYALSNCTIRGKNFDISMQNWLQEPEHALDVLCGPPHRDRTRTLEKLKALFVIAKVDRSYVKDRDDVRLVGT